MMASTASIARVATAGELQDLAVLALDHVSAGRRSALAAPAGCAEVDDHALGEAGGLVEWFR